MVLYKTNGLAKPGIPAERLVSGLSHTEEAITVIVGRHDSRFVLSFKKKHLCSIDYFATALSKGQWKETQSGKFVLEEEEPNIFISFLVPWLYQGLDVSNFTSKPVPWVKLFIMADKFRLEELSINVLKHASNLLNDEMFVRNKELLTKDHSAAIECYKLLQDLPARFMVVHIAYMAQQQGDINISSMHIELAHTDWGNEFARWGSILPPPPPSFERSHGPTISTSRVAEAVEWRRWQAAEVWRLRSSDVYQHDTAERSDGSVPGADGILMPLLFEQEEWRGKEFDCLAPPADEQDKRTVIRDYLGMNF